MGTTTESIANKLFNAALWTENSKVPCLTNLLKGKAPQKVDKKKEEWLVGKKGDLTLESWSADLKDNKDIVWSHRIKAEVIDAPSTIYATFPKELPCAGLGCMIYNALEKER